MVLDVLLILRARLRWRFFQNIPFPQCFSNSIVFFSCWDRDAKWSLALVVVEVTYINQYLCPNGIGYHNKSSSQRYFWIIWLFSERAYGSRACCLYGSQLWKCWGIGLIILYITVITALLLGPGTHARSSQNVRHILRMAHWPLAGTDCGKAEEAAWKNSLGSSLVRCKHWAFKCGVAGDTRNPPATNNKSAACTLEYSLSTPCRSSALLWKFIKLVSLFV